MSSHKSTASVIISIKTVTFNSVYLSNENKYYEESEVEINVKFNFSFSNIKKFNMEKDN